MFSVIVRLLSNTPLTVPIDITVEVHMLSLKECTDLKGVLEVVSSSAEFEMIPIRHHKGIAFHRIYDCLRQA